MPAAGRSGILLGLCAIALVACIPVPRGANPLAVRFMTPEQLRAYSEQVFRHQNKLLTRMMFAGFEISLLGGNPEQEILEAERAVEEACSSLNRLASMRSTSESPGALLRGRAWLEVRRCEQHADELEQILNRYGIPG